MKSDQREEMRSWERWNVKTEKQIKHSPETLEIITNHKGPLGLSSNVSLAQIVDLDNVYDKLQAAHHAQVKKLQKSSRPDRVWPPWTPALL